MSETSNAPTARKTSKTKMKDALDSFYWSLDSATGGTREETLRGAPHNITRLEQLAAWVAELAANPAKLLAQDKWVMERAAAVPARLAAYKERYLTAPAPQTPPPAPQAPEAGFATVEVITGADALPGEVLPPAPSNFVKLENPTNLLIFPKIKPKAPVRNVAFNGFSDAALFEELAARGWVINANKSNPCQPMPNPPLEQ